MIGPTPHRRREGGEAAALTREEIWQRLPEELRVNVKQFEAVLENGCGDLWARRGGGRNAGSYRYWRIAGTGPLDG